MTHTIVIVGGNFGGLAMAHYILRHVIPNLAKPDEYNVTVISPSTHSMFKIGAPRVLVTPSLIEHNTLFASISDGFKEYKAGMFTFVQGTAVGLSESAKTITVKTEAGAESTVHYDSLIIATGTTPNSALWGLKGSYKESATAFADMHKILPKATSVLIAGGGPAGVETAGEIAHTYKTKDLTLLSGTTRLLPRLSNLSVGKGAESKLRSMGVKIVHGVQVVSTTTTPEGKTAVVLSDKTEKVVDVYIDATGGIANTEFLPASWLDEKKSVATDPNTLRATKAPAGVYAIGDVASYSKRGIMDVQFAVPALGYSVYTDLSSSGGKLKEKVYKQFEKDMQFVPIGPGGGVGVIFGWKIPSFLVWLAKSRTYFMEKAPGVATGADYVKA